MSHENFATLVRQRYDAQMAGVISSDERKSRAQAWSAHQKLGWPTSADEAWKYSNPAPWLNRSWSEAQPLKEAPTSILKAMEPWSDRFEIVYLVNGGERSVEMGLAGVKCEDGLVSAVAAAESAGHSLHIQSSPSRPILLVHVHVGEGAWSSSLNRIHLAPGVKASLAEIFLSESSRYLRTHLTTVHLQAGAQLEWTRLQQEHSASTHFSEVQAHLSSAARLAVTQVNAGAEWARNSCKISLEGATAEAQVNGLTFAAGDSHVDQRVVVRHQVGLTNSSQLFKGILRDRARGVLNGKIYIAPKAQKVISSQLNHNLLLSGTAEADTKPELEIYADDVKANHGASIGRMDGEKLFYLLSRGIAREEAQRLLAKAFAAEVMMKIESHDLSDLVKDRVDHLIGPFLANYDAGVIGGGAR